MSVESTTTVAAGDQTTQLERLRGEIDSVYFLMYDGWSDELESNRWHYARRWARHLPVTLIQPSQRVPRRRAAAKARGLDNCEILEVVQPRGEKTTYPLPGLIQGAQVMEHMANRGHARPLLWAYNPWLATLYAAVPAVARVYHASENHFDFDGMSEFFFHQLEAMLHVSDLVIPVSSGVADGIRSRVPEARLALVTNGCDTARYTPSGSAAPEIDTARAEFGRVAVFAGNINGRVDFELVQRAAMANGGTLLVVAGPVGPLSEGDMETWRRVLALPNVRHVGRKTSTELAALYRSSDLGFIPYRRERWIVRNGFPLKTLEMAATGLPVVATHMEPIAGLASAIAVAGDDQGFLDSFASRSRSALTDAERIELLEVAAANDYDRKFEQVVESVADSIPAEGEVHTRLDVLMRDLGYGPWSASCTRIFNRFKAAPLVAFNLVYGKLADNLPSGVHRLVPRWLKNQVRGLRVE